MSLSSPLWLFGLIGISLIWWMHRFQVHDRPTDVSAIFLWRQLQPISSLGTTKKKNTDPMWWLRAFCFSLLIIALAGPQWTGGTVRNIHVWFDDSLSMQAEEKDGIRYQLAVTKLIEALQQASDVEATVHLLTQADASITLSSENRTDWHRLMLAGMAVGDALRLPQAVQMDASAEHWLVSDGADPQLHRWLKTAPISNIINIGEASENLAITRLSLRPSLIGSSLRGLVELVNLGKYESQTQLDVTSDQNSVISIPLTLNPGQRKRIPFRLTTLPEHAIRVRLDSGDDLIIDNELSLGPQGLKAPIMAIEDNCGASLIKALHALPALELSDKPQATDVLIACRANSAIQHEHLIRIYPASQYQAVSGTPRWRSEKTNVDALKLHHSWLMVNNTVEKTGTPILTADNEILISFQRSPQRIVHVYLDMEANQIISQAAYPLLIGQLIDLALGRKYQQNFIHTSRPENESRITPKHLSVTTTQLTQNLRSRQSDLSAFVILLAILLLLFDWLGLSRKHATRAGLTE